MIPESGSVASRVAAPAFAAPSRAAVHIGRTLSILAVLFLTLDAVGKLVLLAPVVEGGAALGFSADATFALGVILLASVLVYVVPRSSLLGAVLLTGYLGGAVATHLRLGNPLYSHTLFPVYVGLFVWGGLVLRDSRLRNLFPVRRAD
jgi:hypothetical protein